jgi:hypothetical protein
MNVFFAMNNVSIFFVAQNAFFDNESICLYNDVKSCAQARPHHTRLHTTSYKPEHPESSNNNIRQSKLLNLIHQATALLLWD